MPTLCDTTQCTSCMACMNACPFAAISMKENALAVLSPQIDAAKCRECGLCEKSCPSLSLPELNYPMAAIALYTRDPNDRQTCSSGGLVTTLSKYIIAQGGVVYGVTVKNGHPLFIRVDTTEGLEALKGSKYVYCEPALIYRSVKEDLKAGTQCLFIGLPCDVAGLKKYLRRDYNNLFTVDLVCHGAPPYEYLKVHLESKFGSNIDINDITFRGKLDFSLSVFDSKRQIIYSKNQYEDEYFVAFMRGIMYRVCCYQCPYARPERISDITAGDFWGLAAGALDGYRGKISLALLNTPKGKALFDSSKDSFIWEERTVEEAVRGNNQLRNPSPFTAQTEIFHAEYSRTGSLNKAFKKSGIKTMVRRNKIRRLVLALPKKLIKIIK